MPTESFVCTHSINVFTHAVLARYQITESSCWYSDYLTRPGGNALDMYLEYPSKCARTPLQAIICLENFAAAYINLCFENARQMTI